MQLVPPALFLQFSEIKSTLPLSRKKQNIPKVLSDSPINNVTWRMRLASILTSVQDLFVLEQLGKKVRINSKIICPQSPLFSRAKAVLAKKSDKKPPKLFRSQISKAITLRTSRPILCLSTPPLVIFISGNSLIFKGHETRRDRTFYKKCHND